MAAFPTLASLAAPGPFRGFTLHHRGFVLNVEAGAPAGGRPTFGYTIRHAGHVLVRSGDTFASVQAADRAARCFVDDALGAYDYATAERRIAC